MVDELEFVAGRHGDYEGVDAINEQAQRLLALAQCPGQFLLLGRVYPGSHEPLPVWRQRADAANVANRSVRTHDSLGKIECSLARQHCLGSSGHEFPIFRMHERQIASDVRRRSSRLQTMNLE